MALIVILTNVSGLAPVSDYNYQVLVGDGTPACSKVLVQGVLRGHQRSLGWQALIEQLLQEHP